MLYDLPYKSGMGGAPVILIGPDKSLSIVGIHMG
jgi:hypothetical protein